MSTNTVTPEGVPQHPDRLTLTLVAIEDDWEPITIEGDELAVGLRELRARTGRGPSDAEIDAAAAKVDGLTIRPAAVIAYLRQKEAETAKEIKGRCPMSHTSSPDTTAPTEAEVAEFTELFAGMPAEKVRWVVERLLEMAPRMRAQLDVAEGGR